MKKIRFMIAAICMVFAMTLVIPATMPQVATTVEAATKVKLNKTKATIYAGKTVKLKVSGTKKTVKWSSSNKKIAKVSSKGVVTGVAKGKAKITAKVGTKKYICKVTVKETAPKFSLSVSYGTDSYYKNSYFVMDITNKSDAPIFLSEFAFADHVTTMLESGWIVNEDTMISFKPDELDRKYFNKDPLKERDGKYYKMAKKENAVIGYIGSYAKFNRLESQINFRIIKNTTTYTYKYDLLTGKVTLIAKA